MVAFVTTRRAPRQALKGSCAGPTQQCAAHRAARRAVKAGTPPLLFFSPPPRLSLSRTSARPSPNRFPGRRGGQGKAERFL